MLRLRYATPAPDTEQGWEEYSMPIGNSYFGGNVFGDARNERIQITENSLENPGGDYGGLNSFADLYFRFSHKEITEYERGLSLDDGLAYVNYTADGARVERTYFTSYPDRVLVGKIRSSAPVDFRAELAIPFLTEEEGRVKRGEVNSVGSTICASGSMGLYRVRFSMLLRVISDGEVKAENDVLSITGATDTVVLFTGATNYELRPEVFLEEDPAKKLRDFDPMPIAQEVLSKAAVLSYDELLSRHENDYHALFGRVSLSLCEKEPDCMTDELLAKYKEGEHNPYLETLYFQYGRYLLISSSRPGCLPANLQGVWNCHDKSPWGSGYWHNINVQMNYWPAFVTNLAETFEAYKDFNFAFRPEAERIAQNYIRATIPENASDEPHACGWTIGTSSYAYGISGPGGHSGPGTGGLTTKLFYDAYSFTGNEKALRDTAYPTLLSMAKFLLRCVRNYDGRYLAVASASPEQLLAATWNRNMIQYYCTVGCAFDQQMIWENAHDLLICVDRIGWENIPDEDKPVIEELRRQIDRYDPVQVGWSGQIKEYREETFYGEIGEYRHRHISHLVGLYPGTQITSETPAWLDAARVALDHRSDLSTGWALAHRLNAWARVCDGNRAYRLLSNLIGTKTLPNLWDSHPPFQIDGNFGGTSGIAEMLLQSHEQYIRPLPALPDAWKDGSFAGLVARGGFEISLAWENGSAKEITVFSKVGGTCRIRYPRIAEAILPADAHKTDNDRIEFETEAGKTYTVKAIPAHKKLPVPTELKIDRTCTLRWTFAEPVNVWRAENSASGYLLAAHNVTGGIYTDKDCPFDVLETVTYKITRADTLDASSDGAFATLNHSTQMERERYVRYVRTLNKYSGEVNINEYLGE